MPSLESMRGLLWGSQGEARLASSNKRSEVLVSFMGALIRDTQGEGPGVGLSQCGWGSHIRHFRLLAALRAIVWACWKEQLVLDAGRPLGHTKWTPKQQYNGVVLQNSDHERY